jgi:hypothetical protein
MPKPGRRTNRVLDAAVTSLRFGFEHFLNSYEDAERLRQAVIDIHVGIELLLKERLLRENPLFVLDKIDEKAAIEAHLAKNQPPQAPRPDQRTVGFEGALGRLEGLGLLPKTVDRRRLTRLNQLRNELIHAGSSERLDEGLRLIAGDAVKFVDEFLRKQLAAAPEQVFGASLWTSVRSLSGKVSDERERAFQKMLGQHRSRVETLSPKDLEERIGTSIDFGTDETLTTPCPACDADAYVGIHIEGPDSFDDGVALGGGAYVEEIQCPVCELHLTGDDLDRFQYLADELMAEQHDYRPDEDDG